MSANAWARLRRYRKATPYGPWNPSYKAVFREVRDAISEGIKEFGAALDAALFPPAHYHDREGWLADGWIYREPCWGGSGCPDEPKLSVVWTTDKADA